MRVHWQQSVLLHRMLLDRGVKSELNLYPGVGHRLDDPVALMEWWERALNWLETDHRQDGSEKPGKDSTEPKFGK